MTKFIFSLLTVFLVVIALTPFAFAQENFQQGEVLTLPKDQVIDNDYFAWGEKVTVSGTVNNDAYIAGGNVLVDGNIKGDLLVAGGNVTVSGTIEGDLRAAGGNINISGIVLGNTTTTGGSVELQKSAELSGNLVAAGGNIEIYSPIKGKGNIAGGEVTLGNNVGSNLNIGVGKLTLTSQASVNGDLNYWSDEEANIAKEATISGAIIRGAIIRNEPMDVGFKEKDLEKAFAGFQTAYTTASFLSTLLIGLLFVWLSPNFLKRTSSVIVERPLASIGVGLITLIITPFIIIILLITLIGIPLGLILFMAYILLLYLSKIFVAVLAGQRVLSAIKQKENLPLALLLGLIVLTLISFIPIIGWLIGFVVMLLGMGAYLLIKREFYLTLRNKKSL